MRKTNVLLMATALAFSSSPTSNAAEPRPTVEKVPFGTTRHGQSVEMYTLRNSHGLEAKVLTFGAAIYSLEVPDRDRNNFV